VTRREQDVVAALAQGLVAPVPPLPPVGATDTIAAFQAALDAGPALNRLGLRVALRLLDRRAPRLVGERRPLRALEAARQQAALAAARGDRVLGPALEPLRGMVQLSYYGDAGVLRTLGYDPGAVVARATEARR